MYDLHQPKLSSLVEEWLAKHGVKGIVQWVVRSSSSNRRRDTMLSKDPTMAITREQLRVKCTKWFTMAAACLLISISCGLRHASISTKRSMAPTTHITVLSILVHHQYYFTPLIDVAWLQSCSHNWLYCNPKKKDMKYTGIAGIVCAIKCTFDSLCSQEHFVCKLLWRQCLQEQHKLLT
jgi:hypothetical protein